MDERDRPEEEAGSGRGGGVWLFAALAVGLVRFYRLGDWSLWYDEAITLADAHHSVPRGGVYNPLGYVAIKSTVDLLGGVSDEFALRFLPALMGWAAIGLTYWAFRPFAGGHRAGLAALLVAASSWQVYWSQNARFYTMAEAVALLGSGLVLRGFFRGGVWKTLLGGGLVALGAWLQLQSALLFAAIVVAPWCLPLVGLRLERAGKRAAVALLVLALVAGLARIDWVLEVWSTYRGNKEIAGGLGSKISSVAHFVLSTGFYVTPLLGAAFLVGAVGAVRARDTFHSLALLVVAAGIVAAVIAALLARVTAQYVFVFLPWIALLAAWPIEALRGRAILVRAGYALVLLLPALANSGLYFFQRYGERPRWREAYHYVWAQRGPEDLVLGMAAPVGEYYLAPERTDLRRPELVGWLDKHRATVPDKWLAYGRDAWFVIRPDYLETWESADRASFQALLREECRLMRRFPVEVEGRNLTLEVYFRKGS